MSLIPHFSHQDVLRPDFSVGRPLPQTVALVVVGGDSALQGLEPEGQAILVQRALRGRIETMWVV